MKELAIIQKRLKCPKSHHNQFGNYDYRNTSDILDAFKSTADAELLDCSIILTDGVEEYGGRVFITATATISNGTESVSTKAYAELDTSKKGMDLAQVSGAASSYARKYALNGLLAIDDTPDNDALDNRPRGAQRATYTPATKKQQPATQPKAQTPATPAKKPIAANMTEAIEKVAEWAAKNGKTIGDLHKMYEFGDDVEEIFVNLINLKSVMQ